MESTQQENPIIEQVKEQAMKAWNFVRFLVRNYIEDNCQTTAAALTYQTLFAVVPSLTVMYTVLSAFEAFGGMGRTIEDLLFENIVPDNVSAVQEYLRSFSDQARSLSVPSLVILAVTAFLMLFTIERTFNEIWGVKEPRHGFQRVMMYWAVLTMGPLLLVMGIGITTYVLSLPLISDVAESPLGLRFLPLALSAGTFTLIYVVVPNTLVPLKHAVAGGFLVATVFETAKFSFGFFMSQSSFEVIYGTFAVVPLFLIWIYVSWTIVLFGAELVKALAVYRFKGSHKLESPFLQVLIILEIFYRAHQRGEVVTDKAIRRLDDRIDLEHWQNYRERLIDLNLVKSVERGGLVLSFDLSELTLWQLYQKLPWPIPSKQGLGESEWEKNLAETFSSITSRNREMLSIDLETLFRAGKVTRLAEAS